MLTSRSLHLSVRIPCCDLRRGAITAVRRWSCTSSSTGDCSAPAPGPFKFGLGSVVHPVSPGFHGFPTGRDPAPGHHRRRVCDPSIFNSGKSFSFVFYYFPPLTNLSVLSHRNFKRERNGSTSANSVQPGGLLLPGRLSSPRSVHPRRRIHEMVSLFSVFTSLCLLLTNFYFVHF